MWYPTVSEPVKDTTGSRGSATSAAVCSLASGSTDHMPDGRSVSASSSPSSRAVIGVAGAGLMMIGAPTANAGATLCATRFSGKLKGAMPKTGPLGKRRMTAIRPAEVASVSSRCNSPDQRRASSAAQRNVDAPRVTSMRDHMSGLPFSAVINRAISSARAVICCDTCMSASARWAAVLARAAACTSTAACTASSTSAGLGSAWDPTSVPSNGLCTSWTIEPVRGLPATQKGVTLTRPPLPPTPQPGHPGRQPATRH